MVMVSEGTEDVNTSYVSCPVQPEQNFLISANSFVQRACIAALSKEGDAAVARMRAVYDKRRKLMVELMREVGWRPTSPS